MNLPSKKESETFMWLMAMRNQDLLLPPNYEKGQLSGKQTGVGLVY